MFYIHMCRSQNYTSEVTLFTSLNDNIYSNNQDNVLLCCHHDTIITRVYPLHLMIAELL